MKEAYQFPQSFLHLTRQQTHARKDTTPFGTLTSTPPNSQTRRATRRDHMNNDKPPLSTKKKPRLRSPVQSSSQCHLTIPLTGSEKRKLEPYGGPRLRNDERAAKSRLFLVLEELGEDGVADIRAIGQGVFHVDDDDLEGLERKQGWR